MRGASDDELRDQSGGHLGVAAAVGGPAADLPRRLLADKPHRLRDQCAAGARARLHPLARPVLGADDERALRLAEADVLVGAVHEANGVEELVV